MGKEFSSSAFDEFSRMPSTVVTGDGKHVKIFAACLAAMKGQCKRGWRSEVTGDGVWD